MANLRKTVMISSTALDLPTHRKEAISACQRAGMFPLPMENLPADPSDAVVVSLRMVDEADIYLGIFGHRYGSVPEGESKSITEMEYDRAIERGIPCYIFLMHEDHDLRAADVEKGPGAKKLEALKDRLGKKHVANFFMNPEDLRAQIIQSLAEQRQSGQKELHFICDIPQAPELYIAHPYTLLQTKSLVGRQDELDQLTDWVSRLNSEIAQARILSVVAIGGMGKSALTWKWFNDIAPQEMEPMAGRLWWSFYESDAHFENFVIRGLTYVAGLPLADVQAMEPPERERRLLAVLNREPFLLVLDGLERILMAYSRMDAARLDDEDLDLQTANDLTNPEQDVSYTDHLTDTERIRQQQLRKASDPRVGLFLRKLSQVQASRILISSRLIPADLQTETGQCIPGTTAIMLRGLRDQDALELWRQFGVKGSRDALQPLFRRFANYPLLIRVLAGEISRYRPAPGDYDRWCQANPTFDPFSLPIRQIRTHVLEFPLEALDTVAGLVLTTIVGFRMPATYVSLVELLVGDGKAVENEAHLDAVLNELEDRGLLGWDRNANRYDLHPVVRGVSWSRLAEEAKLGIYSMLHSYFAAFPEPQEDFIKSIDDLSPIIERYDKLIGLGRVDEASDLFQQHLEHVTRWRLGAYRQRIELLELLVSTRDRRSPSKEQEQRFAFALSALGESYSIAGEAERSLSFLEASISICSEIQAWKGMAEALCILCAALKTLGDFRQAEAIGLKCLMLSREHQLDFNESIALLRLMLLYLSCGNENLAKTAGTRAAKINDELGNAYNRELVLYLLAIETGSPEAALSHARSLLGTGQALGLGELQGLCGEGRALLELGQLRAAEEKLGICLANARAGAFGEDEAESTLLLAKTKFNLGEHASAKQLLSDYIDFTDRSTSPIVMADALNLLASIELAAGNNLAAVQAANHAYTSAWCDGPPYAYQRGLTMATEVLDSLGATPPANLAPFDESRYEPLPEIELDPPRIPIFERKNKEVLEQLAIAKQQLDWENTTGSARKWWEAFEAENTKHLALVLKLALQLVERSATIKEFFMAYVYSNTDNIRANLHYLDYTRRKKHLERIKKAKEANTEDVEVGDEDLRSAVNRSEIDSLTTSHTNEEMRQKIAVNRDLLKLKEASNSAMKWWEAFETENQQVLQRVLWLSDQLVARKASLNEFFLAWVYSNTDDLLTNLYYFDYVRLKKAEEERKKQLASEAPSTSP
jgi:tetratricopeptide (TPR) repeat protein